MSKVLIRDVSDTTFEEEVAAYDGLVLVDFWAQWCGPCKALSPVLDDVAAAYEGRLKVLKMDVDQNRAVPAKYGIRGIPSLLLFKGGQAVASRTGALSKAQVASLVDGALDT